MARSASYRLVLGSVSAIAMGTILSGCSQPASYAVVDLSGSYGGTGQTAQAYSPVTGQPVYQAVSLYGPQSFPDSAEYVPNAQLAYSDAPSNQVASLGYATGGFDTFGVLEPNELPRSVPQDVPAPFAAPAPILAPVVEVPLEPMPPAPLPMAPPAEPRRTTIEETPLAPLSQAPTRDVTGVSDDYATLESQAPAPSIPNERGGWSGYEPWIPPTFGAEEDEPTAMLRNDPVAVPAEPAPAGPRGSDGAYTSEAQDRLPPRAQQTRLPAPTAVPDLPPARSGSGLRVPKASTAYPRPYELLRPGMWPEFEAPGEGLVEAPVVTPAPQFASIAPPPAPTAEPMAQASERRGGQHRIQRGETLLTISRALGTTPKAIAEANGFGEFAPIYIGQVLTIPARPVDPAAGSVDLDAIPMIDVAELAARAEGRAAAIHSVQAASIPTRQQASDTGNSGFAWPVHGEVYKLRSGQIEIDPDGNAPVAAAAAGTVVHVERGPMGVLVVIEHDNGWRSLTVGLDYSRVRPGERVAGGTEIGAASLDHRVRFELRDADAAVADSLEQLRG